MGTLPDMVSVLPVMQTLCSVVNYPEHVFQYVHSYTPLQTIVMYVRQHTHFKKSIISSYHLSFVVRQIGVAYHPVLILCRTLKLCLVSFTAGQIRGSYYLVLILRHTLKLWILPPNHHLPQHAELSIVECLCEDMGYLP